MDLQVIVWYNRSTNISTLKQRSFHICKRGQKCCNEVCWDCQGSFGKMKRELNFLQTKLVKHSLKDYNDQFILNKFITFVNYLRCIFFRYMLAKLSHICNLYKIVLNTLCLVLCPRRNLWHKLLVFVIETFCIGKRELNAYVS